MQFTSRILRRGLTLVELIIGLAMLGIIGTALASFTLAMSQGWVNSQEKFKTQNISKQTGDKIETLLGNMLYVAQSEQAVLGTPESFMFYWKRDGVLGAADRKAQLAEMALIQYDPADKALKMYMPRATGLTAAQTVTLTSDAWGDPTSPAIISYFKSLDSVECRSIIGGAACGVEVLGANFRFFTPVGGKPMTAYQVDLTNGDAPGTAFGSVPMRGPKTDQF